MFTEEMQMKIVTWLAGVIAAVLVQLVPHVPHDVANYMSIAIIAGVSGYIKRHFADRADPPCWSCGKRASENPDLTPPPPTN